MMHCLAGVRIDPIYKREGGSTQRCLFSYPRYYAHTDSVRYFSKDVGDALTRVKRPMRAKNRDAYRQTPRNLNSADEEHEAVARGRDDDVNSAERCVRFSALQMINSDGICVRWTDL
ncbi:hypothetical protein Trydic_g20476 [Trypoxylus dichotomus]